MSQGDQELRDAAERQRPPVVSPVPAPAANDRWAWALAVLPLVAAVLLWPLVPLGLNRNLPSVLALAASVLLVVVDRRRLAGSGRLSGAALPATAWFLVPPVYLRKRARRLGQGSLQFWVSLGCTLAAPVVGTIVVGVLTLAIQPQAAAGLPACNDPGSAQDVLGAFDNLGPARDAGVHGVSLSGQEETGQGPGAVPKLRYCGASVLASNGEEYEVDYTFEQRPDGVIIRLKLRS